MVSPEIRKNAVTQTCERSIIFERYFDGADLSASMNSGLNIFASGFDPLNGFVQLHRYPSQQRFFAVDVQFGSETASDFRRDHTQFVFRNADHDCDLSSHQVRYLR